MVMGVEASSSSTCDDLFGKSSHLAQTTSVLRNPVFVVESDRSLKNYNGSPRMTRHALLKQQIIDGFGQDAYSGERDR